MQWVRLSLERRLSVLKGEDMVSNVDLILASILTANMVVCAVIGFPSCIINLVACVLSTLCLLYRNVEIEFDDDDLGGI